MANRGAENILDFLLARARLALEKDAEDQSSETIGIINTASKARILIVVDKFLKNKQPAGTEGEPVPQRSVVIPWQEKWELEMGDKVRVNCGLSDFESISRRTVGWQSSYEKVLNKVGIVTSICSTYDCHVQVLFPELPMLAEIYAGLLTKTNVSPEAVGLTRFLPGETVIIKAPHSLVEVLQKGYDSLPRAFLQKVGKVIAVDCEKTPHVSFTGTFTVKVNPALLQKEIGEISIDTFGNSKGISADDEVIVTRSLKKFIESQKKINEWERWMSRLPGKTLRVLLVKDGGLLRVCDKAGRSFNIHTDVVLTKVTENEEDENVGDTYEVGEWVTVKKIHDISKVLEDKGIPISVLEYLQQPAKVMGYNEDLAPGITFDSIYTITVPSTALEKITEADQKKAKEIEKAGADLKVGNEVILNLGPPNYVRDVLLEQGFNASDIKLVTSKALLKGFLGPKHALIECFDGSLRKINRVYVTVPEKFRSPVKGKISYDMILTQNIVSVVEKYLESLNEEKTTGQVQIEAGIKTMYVENGEPSTLRLGIRSYLADAATVRAALLESNSMRSEVLSDELLRVCNMTESPATMLVRLDFDCFAVPPPPLPAVQATLDEKATGEPLRSELHVTERGDDSDTKATPGTQQEPTTSGDSLADYRHLEVNIGGMLIQMPYRISEAQQRDPNDTQNRRHVVPGVATRRITIDGDNMDIHIE